MPFLIIAASIIAGVLGFHGVTAVQDLTLGAFQPLSVPAGGTGWGNIQSGTYLTGNGTGRLSTSTCEDITGSAELCDGSDATGAGGASAFEIATTSGLSVSELAYYTKTSGRTTLGGIATTSLTASSPLSLSNAISVIGSAASALSLDTSGTWTGNAGTATALAGNGANCSAGSYPLGVNASGAVEDCTVATTGTVTSIATTYPITGGTITTTGTLALAFGTTTANTWSQLQTFSSGINVGGTTYTALIPTTRTLTVAGTANQLTSSAGSQDLSSDRTWTLSLPNHVIFPGNFQATNATTTNATTTSLYIGSLTGPLQAIAGHVTATSTINDAYISDALTISSSGSVADGALSANVSLLGQTIAVGELASVDFGDWTCNGTTCTLDSDTVADSEIDYANVTLADFTNDANYAKFEFPFTPATNFGLPVNSTSTTIWFESGLYASSTSRFATINTDFLTVGSGTGLVRTVAGIVSTYAGTSCTNQFVRSLSAAGAATCASISNTDWSGTDLSVANGGTGLSTFGGTNTLLYTTAADTLSSEAALTYAPSTDLLTVLNASTTNLTVGTFFQLPNSTSQSPTLAGACGFDTTSGQFKCGDGSATLVIGNGYHYPVFTHATTSWTGTTTIPLGPAFVAETWSRVMCFTDTGTLNVSFYDGTNRMNMLNASTTVGTVTLSTNNTFTAAEKRYVDVGTPASSPTKISCTVRKAITAD